MAISFVGANTFTSATNSTAFTVNRHASTEAGDLMIAGVAIPAGSGTNSDTLTGWTKLYHVDTADGFTRAFIVYYRYMEAGDPSSWDGSVSGGTAAANRVSACVSYRGVHSTTPFIAEQGNTVAVSGTTIATATLNNTDADAWWVAMFSESFLSDSTKSWTANAGVERADIDSTETGDNASVAIFDSNGVITTGNKTVTGTTASSTASSERYSWLGILNPAPTIVTHSGAMVMSAETSLTNAARLKKLGSTALSAETSLVAASSVKRFATTTLSAETSMTAVGVTKSFGAVTLSADSAVVASGAVKSIGSMSLSADSTVLATSVITQKSAITLSADSLLSTTAQATYLGAAIFSGETSLLASSGGVAFGALELTADSNLSATALKRALTGLVLSADTEMALHVGAQTVSGAIQYIAETDSSISGTTTKLVAIELASSGSLTTAGLQTALASLGFFGETALTADAHLTSFAVVELAADGTLTISAIGGAPDPPRPTDYVITRPSDLIQVARGVDVVIQGSANNPIVIRQENNVIVIRKIE